MRPVKIAANYQLSPNITHFFENIIDNQKFIANNLVPCVSGVQPNVLGTEWEETERFGLSVMRKLNLNIRSIVVIGLFFVNYYSTYALYHLKQIIHSFIIVLSYAITNINNLLNNINLLLINPNNLL